MHLTFLIRTTQPSHQSGCGDVCVCGADDNMTPQPQPGATPDVFLSNLERELSSPELLTTQGPKLLAQTRYLLLIGEVPNPQTPPRLQARTTR